MTVWDKNTISISEMQVAICEGNIDKAVMMYMQRNKTEKDEARLVVSNYCQNVVNLTTEEEDKIENEDTLFPAVKMIRKRTGCTLEVALHVAKNATKDCQKRNKKEEGFDTDYTITPETRTSVRIQTSGGSFLVRITEDQLDIEVGLDSKLSVEPMSMGRVCVRKLSNNY